MTSRDLATVEAPSVIVAAIERGLTGKDLDGLLAAQERWERNEAKKSYAVAMTAAQGEMQPVVRSRKNLQQGSMYAALEDIHEVIKPIWLAHRFTLSYGSDQSPYPDHYRVTCECLHEGGHSTHHVLDGPPDEKGFKGNPNKTPIQATISTTTYLRRALAVMIFDITIVNADKDGQRVTPTVPYITAEQVAKLNEWMIEKEVKLDDFLAWGECESLDKLPCTKYLTGIQMLKDRPAGERKR